MAFNRIRADLRRYRKGSGSLRENIRICRRSPGFRAEAVYRYGRWVEALKVAGWPRTVTAMLLGPYLVGAWVARTCYGIDIDRKADIGEGFRILHFGGIVVEACQIGSHCTIHQHVKILGRSSDDRLRVTKIGSRVWIGPHARVLGGVNIGDGVTIASGAVVEKDIGARCLVAGHPCRVTAREYDNSPLTGERAEEDL